ncbi:MAG: hypothetical protein ACREUS_00590, partial [Burkholderiales bacterium]
MGSSLDRENHTPDYEPHFLGPQADVVRPPRNARSRASPIRRPHLAEGATCCRLSLKDPLAAAAAAGDTGHVVRLLALAAA